MKKLNKITSKNKKIYRTTMKGSGKKQQQTTIRTSRRLQKGKIHIPTKDLGSGNRVVNESKIKAFVKNEISHDVPQVVSLPVPPERHAFLVDVKIDEGKIMISDWGGKTNRNRDEDNDAWNIYCDFMDKLEEKYKLKIQYYNIDAKLKKDAIEHHEFHNNSGGCSNYIYKWIEKHYPDYGV
jgi:hypothetical protein